MRNSYRIAKLTVLYSTVWITACDPPVQEQQVQTEDPATEEFVKANQYMQRRHQDHIAAFVERVGWEARVTASGLWIVMEQPGEGAAVQADKQVTYAYESMLLDGTPCYEATEEEPKTITMGRGGVESGMEQGLLLMREGTEAVLIIPPHLGHGNFGDRDKIPGNSVLIYRVKVMKVF